MTAQGRSFNMLHRCGMEFVPSVIAVVMMGMGILPEEGREGWMCLFVVW